MKKWGRSWFGEKGAGNSWIVIDNRLESGAGYTFTTNTTKLWLSANEKHQWTPAVTMKYSERFTIEEFEQLSKVITDRLNAMEVEKKLKGEA